MTNIGTAKKDKSVQCRFCEDPNGRVVRYSNFKHYWYRCVSCGTMWRKGKEKLPGEKMLKLLRKTPIISKITNRLIPTYFERQGSEIEAYENYGKLFFRVLDPTPGDEMFEVKRRRYLDEASDFLQLVKRNGIDISGKSLLDISGGPGTFAHFIKTAVGKIVVSEYGAQSAEAMKKYLHGVHVLHADINEPWPEKELYDIILYRSCLYFCHDFKTHLKDIEKYLQANGLIYICTTAPTLGNSLRWQFEDYTHNVLYSKKIIEDTLVGEGFSIIESGMTDFYPHFLDHYSWKDRFFHRWGLWNIWRTNGPRGLDARAVWVLAKKANGK